MKRAYFASALVVVSFVACNTRTPIGNGGGAAGAGSAAGMGGVAGMNGFAGMNGVAGIGSGVAGIGSGVAGIGTSVGGAGGSIGVAGSGVAGGVGAGVAGVEGTVDCSQPLTVGNLFLPEASVATPTDVGLAGLAVGDLNGDGASDIIVTGGDIVAVPPGSSGAAGAPAGTLVPGSVVVSLADKAKGFAPPVRTAVQSPQSIALGDIDGDGDLDLDLVAAQRDVSILLNNGAGKLATTADLSAGSFLVGSAISDLDGDGAAELLFGNDGLLVFRSVKGAAYVSEEYGKGLSAYFLAVADVDGDAKPDVVAGGGGAVHVFLNDGAGRLKTPVSYASAFPDVQLTDLDGDGKKDIVAGDYLGRYVVFPNLGNGTFAIAHPLPFVFGGAVFGDLDGNGSADAVVASYDCARVVVYLNDGHGAFGAGASHPVSTYPRAPALGDVNGDGRLDVVFLSNAGVKVLVHRAP